MRARNLLATFAVLASSWSVAKAQEPVVYRIPVTGTIELGLAPYVARILTEADAAGPVAFATVKILLWCCR